MDYYTYLENELITAFGCTEPIAIAYGSALCSEVLEEVPIKIYAKLSGNIIKNANSVKVPSTEGRKGIEISVVAGAFLGDASKKLQVLENIDKKELSEMDKKIEDGIVEISLKEGASNLYIEIEMKGIKNTSRIVIEDAHTNVVLIEKNGEVLEKSESSEEKEKTIDFSVEKIYDFANNCDLTKLDEILNRQIEYNIAIAEDGIENNYGSNIGKLILNSSNNYSDKLVAYASAGSDARMSGSEKPVVINSGSGNQGITVSVPIIIYAKDKNLSEEKLKRALVFGNLLGLYMKEKIGKLSAYCGVVSASAASICGISYLNGDDLETIEHALVNILAVNSGLICDGAKPSCASKIASSLRNAFLGYEQAKSENSFQAGDGIVKKDVEESLEVIGNLARYGMKKTDEVILNEMIEKRDYIDEFK
ncbi:L-serine ammonia-lyase, iron-sulfur-dependent, subunit alpha [Peptoniphilus sp. MSJ-1]|uniref:UPF0597 protein KQI68_07660 n=1 Tax=Peptoniphilus ovalis TaxID=2841503 RepID=A0ABS6FI24_9FIRM|nr:L-serine ammonia-lyase, iron-sulfur-dependent, subunit alpha [Peptoniphilus ovalis]MBU5669708.1 L-serine ammonia-lyase, iron-sulfur-dependent, subunit alpha [Peptoniphilus ovalis]